jgi:hypothetical protein
MIYKIWKNNIINDNYNKKIVIQNWVDKERTDAILFNKTSGSSFFNYVQKLTDLEWLEHSTKITMEKAYGLYGISDIDIVQKQYDGFDYDASRLDRIRNLQDTPWYFLLQNLINSSANFEPIDLYNSNGFSLDGKKIKKMIVKDLLLFRHYYRDNIILHHSSTKMIDNKNWVLLFFTHVDNNQKDKIVFIDSQESICLENNQTIIFPAYLANDFMIIKNNPEETPLYYIQANLILE